MESFEFRACIYRSVADFNRLMIDLKSMQPESISSKDRADLVFIMTRTPYENLRGRIALTLSYTGETALLPVIAKLIQDNIHTKFVGTLIYSCSNLDSYEYLGLFTDIIMVKEDSTVSDAFTVLQKIKSPVDPKQKRYCIHKLKAFQSWLDPEYQKYHDVKVTIEVLEQLPEAAANHTGMSYAFVFREHTYKSAEQIAQLITTLETIRPEELSSKDIEEVIAILTDSSYPDFRISTVLAACATGDIRLLPVLIELIRKHIHMDLLGPLLTACIGFDCYAYLELFVDIVIVRDDCGAPDAFTILQRMQSPVDAETRQYCIHKLKAFLELLEPEHSRYKNVQAAIDLLETMKVKTTDGPE